MREYTHNLYRKDYHSNDDDDDDNNDDDDNYVIGQCEGINIYYNKKWANILEAL